MWCTECPQMMNLCFPGALNGQGGSCCRRVLNRRRVRDMQSCRSCCRSPRINHYCLSILSSTEDNISVTPTRIEDLRGICGCPGGDWETQIAALYGGANGNGNWGWQNDNGNGSWGGGGEGTWGEGANGNWGGGNGNWGGRDGNVNGEGTGNGGRDNDNLAGGNGSRTGGKSNGNLAGGKGGEGSGKEDGLHPHASSTRLVGSKSLHRKTGVNWHKNGEHSPYVPHDDPFAEHVDPFKAHKLGGYGSGGRPPWGWTGDKDHRGHDDHGDGDPASRRSTYGGARHPGLHAGWRGKSFNVHSKNDTEHNDDPSSGKGGHGGSGKYADASTGTSGAGENGGKSGPNSGLSGASRGVQFGGSNLNGFDNNSGLQWLGGQSPDLRPGDIIAIRIFKKANQSHLHGTTSAPYQNTQNSRPALQPRGTQSETGNRCPCSCGGGGDITPSEKDLGQVPESAGRQDRPTPGQFRQDNPLGLANFKARYIGTTDDPQNPQYLWQLDDGDHNGLQPAAYPHGQPDTTQPGVRTNHRLEPNKKKPERESSWTDIDDEPPK